MRGHRTLISTMLGLSLAFMGVAFTASSPPVGATGAPPDAPPGSATTFQLNPLHDGHSPNELKAPLERAWSHDFGAVVAYPVMVNGRVFVNTSQSGPTGSSLWALDASTGAVEWGPVTLGGMNVDSNITADAVNVYSVNNSGTLLAVSQATGAAVWSRELPGQALFTSPPTVRGGTVYALGAGTGGTLYAVDASSGAVRWTAPVTAGDHSSPAVTTDEVVVQFECALTLAFATADGAPRWQHEEGCMGAGGKTPVIHDDKVYVRALPERGRILSTATGAKAGTFTSATPAAFAGNQGFMMQLGGGSSGFTLTAVNVLTRHTMWSQVGDGHLTTPPLAIGDSVAVGSSTGHIALFDASSGIVTWSADAGSPIMSADEHSSASFTGLSTSNGLLLVPATNILVAYASASTRAAARTRLGPATSSQLGDPFWLRATVGPTDGGGTVSFIEDGAATPIRGCEAVRLTSTVAGWASTCPRQVPTFGNHTFTARYNGDAAYAPSKVTISHPVIAAKTQLTVQASPPPVKGADTVRLWASLDAFNEGIAGPPIVFSRDGIVLCTARTNWGGVARCVVPSGGPVEVSFSGTARYRPSSTEFVPAPTG